LVAEQKPFLEKKEVPVHELIMFLADDVQRSTKNKEQAMKERDHHNNTI